MSKLVIHIAGARPNFPKLAPVLRALSRAGVSQQLVHTGQHYDSAMSEVFFKQLGLPEPDVNLGVGSGTQAGQTATIMVGLERLFETLEPGMVAVYGDINSTLAAALVAAKMQIPIAHVEAGLRSFDRSMPEEINRIITDRIADLLFTTSPEAMTYLGSEGVAAHKIHFVGNPMIDTLLANIDQFDVQEARTTNNLTGPYVVATLHRPGNVDDAKDIVELVSALHEVANLVQVVLPLHPRGRARLEAAGLVRHPGIKVLSPLGYVEFLSLVRGAAAVVTDSGGVQEETTVLGVPCLTLRPNTERPVTITSGTNQLVTRTALAEVVRQRLAAGPLVSWLTPPLWDGNAGSRIAKIIEANLV